MQFTSTTSLLNASLFIVKKAVKLNPIVPILDNFLFEVKHRTLIITASDSQTYITTALSVENAEDGSMAVPARILVSTLNFLPEKESVTFNFEDSSYSLTIVSKQGVYKLACENATDFPKVSIDMDHGEVISMRAEILKKSFEQTMFATSQNDNRPSLDGVNMKIGTEGVTFSALGDNQLARYKRSDIKLAKRAANRSTKEDKLPVHVEEIRSITIPTRSIQLLVQLLPLPGMQAHEEVRLAYNANKVCISHGDTHIIARLIEDEFRPYEGIIPLDTPQGTLTLERELFLKSLKMMEVYANKSSHRIKLSLEKADMFQIGALDLDFANEATESHACTYQGGKLEIGFNVKLLIAMLSKIKSQEIIVRFYSSNKPASIVPKGTDPQEDLILLLAPMIIADSEM